MLKQSRRKEPDELFDSASTGRAPARLQNTPKQSERSPRRQSVHLLDVTGERKPHSAAGLDYALWQGDTETLLNNLPHAPIFDLIVTSPPYNIGKSYETRRQLDNYIEWQERIIAQLVPRLAERDKMNEERSAIEALRAGVPNRAAIRVLGTNEREIEEKFVQNLRACRGSLLRSKQEVGQVIAGGFGSGKSHLLGYFQEVALGRVLN